MQAVYDLPTRGLSAPQALDGRIWVLAPLAVDRSASPRPGTLEPAREDLTTREAAEAPENAFARIVKATFCA